MKWTRPKAEPAPASDTRTVQRWHLRSSAAKGQDRVHRMCTLAPQGLRQRKQAPRAHAGCTAGVQTIYSGTVVAGVTGRMTGVQGRASRLVHGQGMAGPQLLHNQLLGAHLVHVVGLVRPVEAKQVHCLLPHAAQGCQEACSIPERDSELVERQAQPSRGKTLYRCAQHVQRVECGSDYGHLRLSGAGTRAPTASLYNDPKGLKKQLPASAEWKQRCTARSWRTHQTSRRHGLCLQEV